MVVALLTVQVRSDVTAAVRCTSGGLRVYDSDPKRNSPCFGLLCNGGTVVGKYLVDCGYMVQSKGATPRGCCAHVSLRHADKIDSRTDR